MKRHGTVYLEAHPDQVGPAGSFTGEIDLDAAGAVYVTVERPSSLGQVEDVLVPWARVRYVVLEPRPARSSR